MYEVHVRLRQGVGCGGRSRGFTFWSERAGQVIQSKIECLMLWNSQSVARVMSPREKPRSGSDALRA